MSRALLVIPLLVFGSGCFDTGDCDAAGESLILSVTTVRPALPPGTYTFALVADGTPVQVTWAVADMGPQADVPMPDGRRLRVSSAGASDTSRRLRIAIVDEDGGSQVGPQELSVKLSIDGVPTVSRNFTPVYGAMCGAGGSVAIVFDART